MKWVEEVLDLQAPRAKLNEEETKRRGVEAQRLMDDPLLKDAFLGVVKSLEAAWYRTSAEDAQGREWLFFQIRAVEKVHEHLTKMVADGQILVDQAEKDQEAESDRARTRKRDRPIESRHR
jgi:hypothetical protein